MEINVNVNANLMIDATPALLNTLNSFAAAFSTPVIVGPADEPKKSRSSKHADKTQQTPAEPKQQDTAQQETAATNESTDPTPEPEKAPGPKQETAPALTLEEVREKLATIARSGKAAEVKELLKSYGVTKLTDVPEDKFAELLAKAEKL